MIVAVLDRLVVLLLKVLLSGNIKCRRKYVMENFSTLKIQVTQFVYEGIADKKITNFQNEMIPSNFDIKILDTNSGQQGGVKIAVETSVDFREPTYRIKSTVIGEFNIDSEYLEIIGKESQNKLNKMRMNQLVTALYNTLMERVRIYSGLFSLETNVEAKIPPLAVIEDGIQLNQ